MFYWNINFRLLRRLALGALALALMIPGAIFYRVTGAKVVTGVADIAVTIHRPPTLFVPPLPGVTKMVTSTGQTIAVFSAQSQIPQQLHQVSLTLRRTLIASEDRTFYTNDGVDARGILRAAYADLVHHAGQGGSTLTQQYVKNLLINEYGVAYGDASTLTRKIREVAYATDLGHLLSKNQILEGYLNTVYFGQGAYGIGAAAKRYFSVPASQLNVIQSALLVALVRSPSAYDPLLHPLAATAARAAVLDAMASDGVISSLVASSDKTLPLGLHLSNLTHGCLTSTNPYFCEWVSSTLLSLPALGPTPKARLARLDAGGLTITTSLDTSKQLAAQSAVISKVGYSSPIGSAIVMVQPGTGDVLAMASNRLYGLNTTKNQTTLNYALSADPVGSTMKLFTLITALEEGIPLTTILPAGATYHSPVFVNPPGGFYTNSDQYDPSYINLATATALSVNTAFVQLEEKTGVLAIAQVARNLGLPVPVSGPGAPTSREGSFTLGARSFTPLEMAEAYATIADGGIYCTPGAVTSITFSATQVVPVAPQCHRVVPNTVAVAIAGLLSGVVRYGTGTAAAVSGYPLVGKTGTTSNYGAAWFDGFTPSLATSAWVGNPLGPSHPLLNIDGVGQVYGGTLPAEEFSLAMAPALSGTTPWQVPALTESYLAQPHTVVPDLRGLSTTMAAQRLAALGLVYTGPSSGTVISTSPSPGTPVTTGQSITVTTGVW